MILAWNMELPQLMLGKSTNNFMAFTCDWHFLEFIDESMSSMKLYPDFNRPFFKTKMLCDPKLFVLKSWIHKSYTFVFLVDSNEAQRNNQTKNDSQKECLLSKNDIHQVDVMRISNPKENCFVANFFCSSFCFYSDSWRSDGELIPISIEKKLHGHHKLRYNCWNSANDPCRKFLIQQQVA